MEEQKSGIGPALMIALLLIFLTLVLGAGMMAPTHYSNSNCSDSDMEPGT